MVYVGDMVIVLFFCVSERWLGGFRRLGGSFSAQAGVSGCDVKMRRDTGCWRLRWRDETGRRDGNLYVKRELGIQAQPAVTRTREGSFLIRIKQRLIDKWCLSKPSFTPPPSPLFDHVNKSRAPRVRVHRISNPKALPPN